MAGIWPLEVVLVNPLLDGPAVSSLPVSPGLCEELDLGVTAVRVGVGVVNPMFEIPLCVSSLAEGGAMRPPDG